MQKSILAFLLLASSMSVFAQDREIEVQVASTVNERDNPTKSITVNYEVFETGDSKKPINWDLSVGLVDAHHNTNMGYLYPGGEFISADGKATFATAGVQARRYIDNRKIIEAVIRADYGQRVAGPRDDKKGYEVYYGERYNDHGGVNISGGVQGVFQRTYGVGAMVTRNLNSGLTQVKLTFGVKFGVRKFKNNDE